MKQFILFISFAVLSAGIISCERTPVDQYNGSGTSPEYSTTPLLYISNPYNGALWEFGSEHTINWKVSPWIKNVDLALFRKDEFKVNIGTQLENNGSLSWSVPSNLNPSVHYRIKIQNSLNHDEYSFSEYFHIE